MKPADKLRMSSKEFDRIMRRALMVEPEEATKPKKVKQKALHAKKHAGK